VYWFSSGQSSGPPQAQSPIGTHSPQQLPSTEGTCISGHVGGATRQSASLGVQLTELAEPPLDAPPALPVLPPPVLPPPAPPLAVPPAPPAAPLAVPPALALSPAVGPPALPPLAVPPAPPSPALMEPPAVEAEPPAPFAPPEPVPAVVGPPLDAAEFEVLEVPTLAASSAFELSLPLEPPQPTSLSAPKASMSTPSCRSNLEPRATGHIPKALASTGPFRFSLFLRSVSRTITTVTPLPKIPGESRLSARGKYCAKARFPELLGFVSRGGQYSFSGAPKCSPTYVRETS